MRLNVAMHHIFSPFLFIKKQLIQQPLNQSLQTPTNINIQLTLFFGDSLASNFVIAIDCVRFFWQKTHQAVFCASCHKNGNIRKLIILNKKSTHTEIRRNKNKLFPN